MISLVVVNYRTSTLAAEAIRTARATTATSLQVIVIDNSESATEASRLRPHADVLLTPPANVGYGAAINLALEHCTSPVIVASNPDVVFDHGALDRLFDEVQAGAAVAGPAFYWDSSFRWHLPPGDEHTLAGKFDEALATRSVAWRRWRDRRRVAARAAFWRLQHAVDVPTLSGAVMAFDAAALNRERFDERFFLYFEETDLLRRIRQHGGVIRYVPSARCRHLFNQSAASSDRAASEFGRSEWQFHEKWHGAFPSRIVMKLAMPATAHAVREADAVEVPSEGLLVEASPLPGFETSAGTFAARGPARPPAEIARSLGATSLYLRVVDPGSGRIYDQIRWRDAIK